LTLLCTALLSGSAARGRVLPSDAYVWQFQWSPALTRALRDGAPLVRDWRVLVAEADAAGRWRVVDVDWAAVTRPAVLVVRLDGRLTGAALDAVPARIGALVRARPGAVAGVEIDHDCGTGSLAGYARLLAAVRARLPASVPLSITMLPDWLHAPALDAVLAQVSEAVLQVHALQNPHAGLFDPAQARRWANAMGQRSDKPFWLALPAYGTRVSWGSDGRLLAVESERPLLTGGTAAELMASPADVSAFLRGLQRDPPTRLAGIVWFRLPTEDDVRAWSPTTWRAVVRGESVAPAIRTVVRAGDTPGTSDMVVENDGDIDAPLPASVTLPSVCAAADGLNGYALADGGRLRRAQAGLLRAHQTLVVGWTRCVAEQTHANP
jgi:hypothetical protein